MATLVLHFNLAADEQRVLGQRRFRSQTQAKRGVRRRLGFNPGFAQLRQHFVTRGFEGIDAQVQRGRLFARKRQRFGLSLAHFGYQPLVEPIREIKPHRAGQVFRACSLDAGDQLHFRRLQERLELARVETGEARQRRQRQITRRACAGHFSERAPVADHAVGSLGREAAFVSADLGVGAKILGQRLVGRDVAGQNTAHGARRVFEHKNGNAGNLHQAS